MSKRKMIASKKELKEMYESGMTMEEIGKEFNCTKPTVWKWFQKYDLEARKMEGENHGNWKGGRVDKGDGYIGIWNPKHSRADNQGYVFEHTLVIEKELGKLPEDNEMIHHINCNKHDNRIENLYLCTRSQHKKTHWSLEKLLPDLIERDIVGFDKEKGKYYLK